MRNKKALVNFLQGLVNLLSSEAEKNSDFAEKLDLLMTKIAPKEKPKKVAKSKEQVELPDIYAELSNRDEIDFVHWLKEQPQSVLRDLIKLHDLDARRLTSKWKDQNKLAAFISEKIRVRSIRGNAFLKSNSDDTSHESEITHDKPQ